MTLVHVLSLIVLGKKHSGLVTGAFRDAQAAPSLRHYVLGAGS